MTIWEKFIKWEKSLHHITHGKNFVIFFGVSSIFLSQKKSQKRAQMIYDVFLFVNSYVCTRVHIIYEIIANNMLTTQAFANDFGNSIISHSKLYVIQYIRRP